MNNLNRELVLLDYSVLDYQDWAGDEIRYRLERADKEHEEVVRVITKDLGMSY